MVWVVTYDWGSDIGSWPLGRLMERGRIGLNGRGGYNQNVTGLRTFDHLWHILLSQPYLKTRLFPISLYEEKGEQVHIVVEILRLNSHTEMTRTRSIYHLGDGEDLRTKGNIRVDVEKFLNKRRDYQRTKKKNGYEMQGSPSCNVTQLLFFISPFYFLGLSLDNSNVNEHVIRIIAFGIWDLLSDITTFHGDYFIFK